jgi:hypothetical protein
MKNVHLYEALKEYCREALDFLKTKPEKDLPTITKQKHSILAGIPPRPGLTLGETVKEVDWSTLILSNRRTLQLMKVYPPAIQAMEEDGKVARHLNIPAGGIAKPCIDSDWCLLHLLIHLLQEQQDMNFQEAVFDSIYEGFEDYFYRDVLEYRYFCPLSEFHMEAERIDLGSKFFIVRISMKEKDRMLSRLSLGSLPYLSKDAIVSTGYAFDFYVEVPKVIGETSAIPHEDSSDQVAREKFDEACFALRLFKGGAIDYDFVQKTTLGDPFRFTKTFGSSRPKPSPDLYVLSNDEIPAFLEFWQFYQKVRLVKRSQVEIALRRFNFAYERKRPEDKLIDYMIGFEALLLKQEQELRYKLALRGSALLGKNPEERERIFGELQGAYKQRNKIVHGDTPKEVIGIGGKKIQFNEFVSRIEEHLRSAIKEFLARCEQQSASEVIKALDEMIVRGFQFKESIRDP